MSGRVLVCDGLRPSHLYQDCQLKSIGNEVFVLCSSLTSITIPDSVASIGNSAFLNCTSLANVTFEKNSQLKSIGNNAFSDCRSLIRIEIPGGVTSIGTNVFLNCYKLYQVTNLSDLAFVIGNTNYGYIAYYAKVIIDGRYCSECGELVEARTVDALGHDYSVITVVDPTCTDYGYTIHKCSRCGDCYLTDITEKIEHTESAWMEDVEADCTHAGSRHKECTVCGEILKTEVIKATGHIYGEIQTEEATCEQAGYTYHKCSVCGEKEKLWDILALGHTEGEWIVDVEADCTHAGSQHKVCTV